MVSFKASRSDRSLISQIVARASEDGLISGEVQCLLLEIDLVAVHQNGCPIRLADLLAAEDEVFSADVMGIATHHDRMTGGLMNGYRPQFAAGEVVPA